MSKGASNGKLYAAASEFFLVIHGIIENPENKSQSPHRILISPRTKPNIIKATTSSDIDTWDFSAMYFDWANCLLKYAEFHRLDRDRWQSVHKRAGFVLEIAFAKNPDHYEEKLQSVLKYQAQLMENEFYLSLFSPTLQAKLKAAIAKFRALRLNSCFNLDPQVATLIAESTKENLTKVSFDECFSMSTPTFQTFVSICTNIKAISLVKCYDLSDSVSSAFF